MNDSHQKLSAQIPTQMLDELAALAHERDRSVSAEVRQALRSHLERSSGVPQPSSDGTPVERGGGPGRRESSPSLTGEA
jgi:hypothetical protein